MVFCVCVCVYVVWTGGWGDEVGVVAGVLMSLMDLVIGVD